MAPNEVLSLTQFPARRHQADAQHVQREGTGEGAPAASRPGKREGYGSGTVGGVLLSGEVREGSVEPETSLRPRGAGCSALPGCSSVPNSAVIPLASF